MTAGPETWALVKAGFLAGHAAPVLARHYGVRAGEIYRRSCQERWVKAEPGEAPISRPSRPERLLDPAPDPVAPKAEALPVPVVAEAAPLQPPPPPLPSPAIDTGRLAASALEGAAALLAEGRMEAAAAYLKLADMGSRVGERAPAEAPTPEQAARWEAARDFYTGRDPESRDLPAWLQWRLVSLLHVHGEERAHVLDAARRERRTGSACGCALCARVPGLDREVCAALGPAPATSGAAAELAAATVGEARTAAGR